MVGMIMENKALDYTFTIIEDGQVPLAGNFDTFSYAPVVAIVIAVLAVLAIAAYTVWSVSRVKRLAQLTGENSDLTAKYYLRPASLLRDMKDAEYSVLSDISRNIA